MFGIGLLQKYLFWSYSKCWQIKQCYKLEKKFFFRVLVADKCKQWFLQKNVLWHYELDICTYMYTHVCVCTHTSVCVCLCVCIYIYVCVCVCVHPRTHAPTCTHTHARTHIYVARWVRFGLGIEFQMLGKPIN